MLKFGIGIMIALSLILHLTGMRSADPDNAAETSRTVSASRSPKRFDLSQPPRCASGTFVGRRRNRRRKIAAIYARYSTNFQASVEDQIRSCREWAEANGYEVPARNVFVDRGVTGKQLRRDGLTALKAALAKDEIDCLVLFHSSRLMRSSFRARAFIEEELVDIDVRCVCIRQGIDTNDEDQWRALFGMNSIMDEMMLKPIADNVRAAHETQLINREVFGTETFGYTGEAISGGGQTRRGRPKRRIVIDETCAEWVRSIFAWYIGGKSVAEIVVMLRDRSAPLPPRARAGWTQQAVTILLKNSRYTGWWAYGWTRTRWMYKKDYARQERQENPRREKLFESLRIIDDLTYAKAQSILAEHHRRGGRKTKDGSRSPRVLNGLFYCPKHDRTLNVSSGTFFCPECRRSSKPHLYSGLRVKTAVNMVCRELARHMQVDQTFIDDVIEAFRRHVTGLQRPDTGEEDLRRQESKLTASISFILANPGETEQDQKENAAQLKSLRAKRAGIDAKLKIIETERERVPQQPTPSEIAQQIKSMQQALLNAASGRVPDNTEKLRELIEHLTGGRINCYQCGEALPKRGWLCGKFKLSLVRGASNGDVAGDASPPEITVEFRDATETDALAAKAMAMLKDGTLLMQDVAKQLGVRRNRLTGLIARYCRHNGLAKPDGRTRRQSLQRKHAEPPLYQKMVDAVMERYQNGMLLQRIAKEVGVDRTTVVQAIRWWHESKGLAMLDGRARRKSLEQKTEKKYRRRAA